MPKAAYREASLLRGEPALSPLLAPYCLSELHHGLHDAKCRILESGDKWGGKRFSCCHVPKKKLPQENNDQAECWLFLPVREKLWAMEFENNLRETGEELPVILN